MGADHWLGVELRHLATLSAIVREGSFRAAATRLGYADSAVSQHIAELERAVGCRLIERPPGRAPIRPTRAGELLAGRAERVLAGLGSTRAELLALEQPHAGAVRLGVLGRAARLLPRMVAAAGLEDSLALEAHESASDDVLFERVRSGELDLTLGEWPPPPGPFAGVELLSTEWVVVAPADAAPDRVFSMAEVACMTLIGARRSRAHALAEQRLLDHCPDAQHAFRTDSVDRVLALVAARVGVALTPRLGVEHDARVSLVKLADPPPPFTLGLFWHAHTSLRPDAARVRRAIERDIASAAHASAVL